MPIRKVLVSLPSSKANVPLGISNMSKKTLQVRVYASKDSRNPVFERIVDTDFNVSFCYHQVVDSLRFLFGRNCVVSFNDFV